METRRIRLGRAFRVLEQVRAADRFVLIEGPRGTGKTRAILTVLMRRGLEHPGARILLARSTRSRLSQSVLVTLEEQVYPAFGFDVPSGGNREQRQVYPIPGGSCFVTMGMDDQQRTQSAEYAWIYVAEATELAAKDDVLSLAGSLRQAGMPDPQVLVDLNPGPPAHWANQIAEPAPATRHVRSQADYWAIQAHNLTPPQEGRWKRILTRLQDNPHYWDSSRWCYTKAGQAYVETLGFLTGHLRRRWLDGDWVSAEGSVYPEFDEARHVVPAFEVPNGWPCWVGFDPGYDHPAATLWVTVAPNGTLYVMDELYRGGLAIARHAEDIKARNHGRTIMGYYADPQHAFSSTAQSPETIAEQFAKCGLNFAPWPRTQSSQNERAMVEAVRQLLIGDRLRVFATCTNTITEFQSWSWKRTTKGELPAGEDAFEDRNNHCMDALRGLVATHPSHRMGRIEVL